MATLRLDVPRAIISLVAAGIGACAAVAVAADATMAGRPLAVGVFGIEAIIAVAFGLRPSPGRWGDRRRTAARAVTSGSIIAGLFIVTFVGARTGCACVGVATTLPTVLGIESPTWMDIGTFGVPLLFALAASAVPDRLRRP
jgi:hypothetical protein